MTDEDLSGTVTLADGEEVEIPRPDMVYPIFGEVSASLDVAVQQDRIRMCEQDIETEISLATCHRSIPPHDGPIATMFSGVSSIHDDDSYAEVALPTLDEVEALRDACELILRYHGDDTEVTES